MQRKALHPVSKKKKLKTECLKLLRELVILRDGERCLRCGKTNILHLSHIYPKGKQRGMELDPDNLKLLCAGCHIYWWHKSPLEAQNWLVSVLPPERLQRLKLMSQTAQKVDLELQKLYLESEVKKLKKRQTNGPSFL